MSKSAKEGGFYNKLKKYILVMFFAALLAVAGCAKEDVKTGGDAGESEVKESVAYNPDTIKQENVNQSYRLDDAGQISKLGDDVDISYYGVHYKCKVKDIKLTKTFKQDVSQWEMDLEPYSEVSVTGGKITNDYTIIYITAEVTNLADKKLDYGVTQVSPMWLEDDGNLNNVIEAGYFNRHKSGKSYFYLDVEPGKTEEFELGYVLKDERVKKSLYVNLAGGVEAKQWILVPVEDKTLEE